MMNLPGDQTFMHVSIAQMLSAFVITIVVAGIILLVPIYVAASAPDDATGSLLVAFPPAKDRSKGFLAIQSAGGLPVRQTEWGNFWVVQAPKTGFVQAVQNHGAIGVFRDVPSGIVLAGCTGVIAQLQQ